MSQRYSWHVYEKHGHGVKLKVASGDGHDLGEVLLEAHHYAAQYAQDFDVLMRVFQNRRVVIREEWSKT